MSRSCPTLATSHLCRISAASGQTTEEPSVMGLLDMVSTKILFLLKKQPTSTLGPSFLAICNDDRIVIGDGGSQWPHVSLWRIFFTLFVWRCANSCVETRRWPSLLLADAISEAVCRTDVFERRLAGCPF